MPGYRVRGWYTRGGEDQGSILSGVDSNTLE